MTTRQQSIAQQIHRLVDEYFVEYDVANEDLSRIPLSVPPFSSEEVNEAIDSLLSTNVTMGRKVAAFERRFADYLGVRHAVMVNSGSSANLIALAVLTNPSLSRRIEPGDEVIVPAVAWATTYFPIANVGALPVLVDVDLDDYTINIEAIEDAITPRTRAIMPVHLMGNPCGMDRIMQIADENGLFVIEDSCEAHGSEFSNRKVGTFGDVGTFSFFFSHHITTIEGGMVVTNNDEYANLAKSLRAHGWIREMTNRSEIAARYHHIDQRFLFSYLGYNLRPTEIQGAFGIHQIEKLEGFIEARRENARYWSTHLAECSEFLRFPSIEESDGARRVWFGYPVRILPGAPFTREELTRFLEQRRIETRPLLAGNIAQQPVIEFLPHRIGGALLSAEELMQRAFFVGNHAKVGTKELDHLVQAFREFTSGG